MCVAVWGRQAGGGGEEEEASRRRGSEGVRRRQSYVRLKNGRMEMRRKSTEGCVKAHAINLESSVIAQ